MDCTTGERGFGVLPPSHRARRLSATYNSCHVGIGSLGQSNSGRQDVIHTSRIISSLPRAEEILDGTQQDVGIQTGIVSIDDFPKRSQRESDSITTSSLTEDLSDDDDSTSAIDGSKVGRALGGGAGIVPKRSVVRFQEDEFGNVVCHSSIKPMPLTPQDVQDFWWSREEIESIRERARKLRQYIVLRCPDYLQATYQLLFSLGAIQRPNKESMLASDAAMTDNEALAILFQCDARGFEKTLLLQMDIPFPSYHYSVYRLLQTQSKIAKSCRSREKADILAQQYRAETRAAVKWARVLAYGDAMAHTTTLVDI